MEPVIVIETSKPFAEACRALEDAVPAHGFGIMHVHDVRATLAKKGVPFDRDVRIFEVCNPARAKAALDANPLIATALPCAIAVFVDRGRTTFAFLRPTVVLGWFGSGDLRHVAEEVEATVTRIVEAAAA